MQVRLEIVTGRILRRLRLAYGLIREVHTLTPFQFDGAAIDKRDLKRLHMAANGPEPKAACATGIRADDSANGSRIFRGVRSEELPGLGRLKLQFAQSESCAAARRARANFKLLEACERDHHAAVGNTSPGQSRTGARDCDGNSGCVRLPDDSVSSESVAGWRTRSAVPR